MGTLPEDNRPGAAERASIGRPGQFKATLNREEEAARRRAALASQQSEARAGRIADVRRIAMESLLNEEVNDVEHEVEVEDFEEEDADAMVDVDADQKSAGRRMRRLRRLHRTLFFARQFQVPDWMVEIPTDLEGNWLLQVRPEGDRCLLLSDGGRVEVRRKNGFVLERYSDSRMPRGLTILDVVCIERCTAPPAVEPQTETRDAEDLEAVSSGEEVVGMAVAEGRGKGGGRRGGKGKGKGRRRRPQGDRKYAVMDVLVWGDVDMVGADAECRMFWLESRFSEIPTKPSRRARALQLISATAATREALIAAYDSDVGYVKDSFMFLHRQGHYCISEPVTPLALLWRDRKLSRFVVDTPDQKGEVLPEKQAVVLELRNGGRLRTADHSLVAQLSEEALKQTQELLKGAKTKGCFRFEVQGVDVATKQLAGLQVVALVPGRSRVWPDSWGRIAFQHLHRTGETKHISFEVLLDSGGGGPSV